MPAAGCRLTGALFHTSNENVIYTIDATAVPPLFNQDDAQRVKGSTLGLVGQITDALERDGQLRLPGRRVGLAERRRQQRQPADADARELRQHVDDLRLPAA